MRMNNKTQSITVLALEFCSMLLIAFTIWSCEEQEPFEYDQTIRKVRIYTETVGLGHSFITIDNGSDTKLYTYGRYGETHKILPIDPYTAPNGEGVLIRLEGVEALYYIKHKFDSTDAKCFQIMDADAQKVLDYFENRFNSSEVLPKKGLYAYNEKARVIDVYHIVANNCTTILSTALRFSGSKYTAEEKSPDYVNPGMYRESSIYLPRVLEADLLQKAKNPHFSGVANITDIALEEIVSRNLP